MFKVCWSFALGTDQSSKSLVFYLKWNRKETTAGVLFVVLATDLLLVLIVIVDIYHHRRFFLSQIISAVSPKDNEAHSYTVTILTS